MVVLTQNYDMTTLLYIPEWAVMATVGKICICGLQSNLQKNY